MNINAIVPLGSSKCCGCTACYSICPKHCITMTLDTEGFLYPCVNNELCIDCEKCIKVCPFHNTFRKSEPKEVFAAINTDEKIRMESSSGGIFSFIAEQVIKEGGVVFGAKFTNDWQVEIAATETIEGLSDFRGSKYLQARMGQSLKQAKSYLLAGRKVLFCATPCQIAGLNHYLGKDYDNLITVDFVCHGVPSGKVWDKYIKEVAGIGKKAIKNLRYRTGSKGLKHYHFILEYNSVDGSYTMRSSSKENHYMQAFLSDMILRPSCYACQAKCGRSQSDITLADFWGIEQVYPEIDDDKGTSLLLVHSDKGLKALESSEISLVPTSYLEALKHNPSIESSANPHIHRSQFFQKLESCDKVVSLIIHELKPSLNQRIINLYHVSVHILKLILKFVLRKRTSKELRYKTVTRKNIPISPSEYKIANISFRSKISGWKNYSMAIKLTKLH